MNLYSQLEHDFAAARVRRDELAINTLGLLKSEMFKLTKEPGGPKAIDDTLFVRVANKEIKRREEAAAAFEGAGRVESAAKERAERELIAAYLPPAMTEAELEIELRAVIDQVQPIGPAGFGQVMKAATQKLAGRAEGSQISAMAKRLLA
ncbi:MAG TPA: GatB/YqeY domain-containing protein [Candidatus Dormibacteraeota bacterium]|nr:GatB/YqeY domain-containing protein [Candidatus Dormibacteraeota bacterium]